MVRLKPRRNHDKVVLASVDKHPTAECAAHGAPVNRSVFFSDKEMAAKHGGNRCGKKPRPPFFEHFDVSQNHDQTTHNDLVLGGNDLQMTKKLATKGVSAHRSTRCREKRTAVDNDDTHHGSKPSGPFKLRYVCNTKPSPITYVLQGFECSFLDRRCVSFVEAFPTARVCAICWAFLDKIIPLPCGHAVCLVRLYNAYDIADKPHQDNKALSMFRSGMCHGQSPVRRS